MYISCCFRVGTIDQAIEVFEIKSCWIQFLRIDLEE